jgi:membrane protease YdiL (CAAX protease family)
MNPAPAFPGPLQAALLTLLASFVSALIAVLALEFTSPTTAMALAAVVGLGAAGALGAASIPPPHAERVGLRGLPLRQLAPLLLLLPVALLATELGHLLRGWLPPPDAAQVTERALERLPTDDGLAIVETLITTVGLAPVIEEWFFRGVLQQGLVARLGAVGGVVLTALLFAFGHGAPGLSPQSWLVIVAQGFVLGLTFGFARHVTGSLLAAILLHLGVNGAGVLGLAGADRVAIPGYNAPGAHLPLPLLIASLAAVAVAIAWLLRGRDLPRPDPDDPPDTA